MSTRSWLGYELRVAFGWTALLPSLLLPAFALVQLFFWQRQPDPPKLRDITLALEVILPLTTALAAARLMTLEREERFIDLRRSYPEPPWRLVAVRTLGACLLGLLGLMLGTLIFRIGYGPFPLAVLLPPLAPVVFLLAISLLAGTLSGSYWAAAAVPMAWWFFEILTRGNTTKLLALFLHSWPMADVNLTANRWLLCIVGAGLMLLNGWLQARRLPR